MTQFGILLPRAPSSAPERWFDHLVDMTTGAEETGFRSVWVDDPPVAAPGGLEAVTLLGGLGARTSTVRLGMLAALSCRPAGILAKMVTTLDVITRGRVELGLGLVPGVRADGSRPGEAEPAEEVGEAVVVCRALFTGDDVSFTGHHNRLEHARNLPPPVQPGGPTLMVGGLPTPTTSSHADRLGCRLGVDRVGPFVDLVRRSGGSWGRELPITWFVPRESPERGESDGGPDKETVGAPEGPGALARWVLDHAPTGVDEVVVDLGTGGPDAVRAVGVALGLGPHRPAP